MRELRASDSIVGDGLSGLQAAGLVRPSPDGLFVYAPASAQLDRLVQELARLYRDKPTLVTKAIFGSPDGRLQSFADAFRLKKE